MDWRAMMAMAMAGLPSMCTMPPPNPPVGFSDAVVLEHRLSGESEVRTAGADTSARRLYISVDIDPSGKVIRARMNRHVGEDKVDATAALQAARQWRFRPFLFEGRPVTARGQIPIDYRPAERWAAKPGVVPDVRGRPYAIRLMRSGCFGDCPAYSVIIESDGRISFSGYGYLIAPGEHISRVRPEAVSALFRRFHELRFFDALPSYHSPITDSRTTELAFMVNGRITQVADYVGLQAGMPRAIDLLEKEVDRFAGTDRWIAGNAATVDALAAEGFDFSSRAAQEMLLEAASQKDDGPRRLALALMARGVPFDRPFAVRDTKKPLGILVALAAAESGNRELLDRIGTVWLGRASARDLSLTLAKGAGGCDPAIVRLLVKTGADPNAKESEKTALHRIGEQYGPCGGRPSAQMLAVARTLMTLGADPNRRDQYGFTPLFDLSDADLAAALIAGGAKVNVRSFTGGQPVASAGDDNVALVLLHAGADPEAVDYSGVSLRQRAYRSDLMPSTRVWLYLHDVTRWNGVVSPWLQRSPKGGFATVVADGGR